MWEANKINFDLKEPKFIKRFNAKVSITDGIFGCWIWTGAKNKQNYGRITGNPSAGEDGKQFMAHRIAYEMHIGEIPEGLHIDHLCCVTSCVNPHHLEVVTFNENMRRKGVNMEKITHCHMGHEYTEENTQTSKKNQRSCKKCQIINQRIRRDKLEKLGQGYYNKIKTECKHGHEYTPENTYIYPNNGRRECIICRKAQIVKFTEKKKSLSAL